MTPLDVYDGLERREVPEASAGEIVFLAGLDDAENCNVTCEMGKCASFIACHALSSSRRL